MATNSQDEDVLQQVFLLLDEELSPGLSAQVAVVNIANIQSVIYMAVSGFASGEYNREDLLQLSNEWASQVSAAGAARVEWGV